MRRGRARPKARTWVTVGWELGENSVDTTRFEELMRAAEKAKLLTSWDDGRGRDMWYQAWRGPAERALRAACVKAIGTAPSRVRVYIKE